MQTSRFIYAISYIKKVWKKDFELSHDDGLGVVRNKCGEETAKIKKCIPDIFDVSLKLNNSNYKPYHKPDIEILCIHKGSNHPHSILKHIPTLTEKTISTFSCNENIFNE